MGSWTAAPLSRGRLAVIAGVGVALAMHALLPLSHEARDWFYNGVAAVSLAVAAWSIRRQSFTGRPAWTLMVVGYSLWLVADILYTELWTQDDFPGPPDAVYLLGYVLMVAAGVVAHLGQRSEHDLMALLDAAIVTVGVAVPAVAFVIAPVSADTSLPMLGRLVATAYPLADLFLLAVLARLILMPGGHTPALRLLSASLATTFLADCAYNLGILQDGNLLGWVWANTLWLASYPLLALACLHPSVSALGEATSGPPSGTRGKLSVLAGAAMLPGVTLLLDGRGDGVVAWQTIGVGVVVLSGLVLARMALMLGHVQTQAADIAAVARVDSLTGAPNRRTWDHELARACVDAHESTKPLSVAMIDLDHFKRYNDEHGHQSGDRLLRETVLAWTRDLDPGHLLARYGGEAFAMLLPGLHPTAARAVVERLRARTPGGQTFSAGVAAWHPGTEPSSALAAADRALYRAKRAGRDLVLVADDPAHPTTSGPAPRPR